MRNIFNNKRYIIDVLFAILALALSLVLSYTVCSEYFRVEEPNAQIRIENTATKNILSYGSDVRIRSITIDQEKIPFEELKFNENEWIYLDGVLVSVNPTNPVSISYYAQDAKTITIELQKHHGSGVIAVFVNDRMLGKMDLYSSEWEEVTFHQSLGRVKISSNLPIFLIIFVTSIYIMKGWCYIYKKRDLCPNGIFALLGICVFVTFLHMIFGGGAESEVFAIIEIIGFTIILDMHICTCKKDKNYIYVVKNMIILMFSALIQFYIIEMINGNIGTIGIKYIFGNTSIYFVIFWLLYIIFRKMYISVGIGAILLSSFGIVNYFVVKFRGSPIVPGDFFVLETAKSVAGNYRYTLTGTMAFAFVFLLDWIVVLALLEWKIPKISKKCALIGTNGIVFLIAGIMTFDFYQPRLDLWNLNNNVKMYGIAMSLMSNIRSLNMEEPRGYSREKLELLCEDYIKTPDQDGNRPNIIAIMNESFSDLSVIDPNLDSNSYMPYYNSLENTIKGNAMVSTIGGGTANTEYEFLTGNTMGFMPGTVPYQQYILGKTYSLVDIVKNLGYYASAIHPYDKKGYNRYKVYPYLGFDEFIDIEDFENAELVRDRYISDSSSYEKVIQTFERIKKSGVPAFIFNVTMQNHSDYETGYFEKNVVAVTGREGVYPDVEEYLTLIKESDDALSILIDYFSKVDEPTVIVFFGDHQPKIGNAYYEEVMGKNLGEWDLIENQKRYVVPFFIWANYEIAESDDINTSINYLASLVSEVARIPKTPYQNFQLAMREEIPAININGYQTKDGIWHSYSENIEVESLVNNYKNIQYNNVFDKKKCEKWFVVN